MFTSRNDADPCQREPHSRGTVDVEGYGTEKDKSSEPSLLSQERGSPVRLHPW